MITGSSLGFMIETYVMLIEDTFTVAQGKSEFSLLQPNIVHKAIQKSKTFFSLAMGIENGFQEQKHESDYHSHKQIQ